MDKLARRGVADAEKLWHMTPREIMARLKRENALRNTQDKMAWIMARYIALAVHCPEKLPAALPEEKEAMKPEDMKAAMRAWEGVKAI